jgi:alkylhydroperoxidase family enzyme
MAAISFAGSELPVRRDLIEAHEQGWASIARPGTWLTGERRVAVAAEVRRALECALCARITKALSPHAVQAAHDSLGRLSPAEVELVHRVASDPGRLTEAWANAVLARGVSDGQYIETVAVVAMVMIMDTCMRALGLPLRPVPAPISGEPTRYRPAGAKKQAAWLPLTEPEDATAADGPMYPSPKAGYIYRALSLVPQALRDYWALACAHYLPPQYIYQFDTSIRAITRPQTEILAARVSAMHQCVY